jgi:hypothetical protein
VHVILDLEQEGPKVKGTMQITPSLGPTRGSGPVEGRVGGDVLHFRVITTSGEPLTGELTVSGDEMAGTVTVPTGVAGLRITPISLRRADAPESARRQSP